MNDEIFTDMNKPGFRPKYVSEFSMGQQDFERYDLWLRFIEKYSGEINATEVPTLEQCQNYFAGLNVLYKQWRPIIAVADIKNKLDEAMKECRKMKREWEKYQALKKESRIAPEEQTISEDPAERRQRETLEKENKIIELYNKGLKYTQISVVMGIGHSTVAKYVRQGLARKAMEDAKSLTRPADGLSYLYKPIDSKGNIIH